MTSAFQTFGGKTARSPWDIAADIIDDPEDTWEPLPHQIPPPGNWFAWLLMGGRGMGKTATAARHVHEHVMGPPCLPGVPGGHWVGIIGPTLGDAVTSCALGPSGLRAHDPGLKVRQTAGGTTVRWSNGAEGKIFGAHTPEDVERLRSGGNRCLTADTLVDGRPIVQVRPGDYVRTRNGKRRVLANRSFGVDRIWNVMLSDGTILRCTADHPWWVEGHGWTRTDRLWPGAKMVQWQEHHVPRDTSRSGNKPMDLFRRVTSSITRTLTRRIIALRTWKSLRTPTTGSFTTSSEGRIGTARAGRLHGSSDESGDRIPTSVRNAEQSFRHSTEPRGAAIAVTTELERSATQGHESLNALTAARRSSQGVATLVSVVDCVATEAHEEVFCLTVEYDHEFFANDILSSNCLVWAEELAAWRYMQECWQHMRYGLRVGPWPHVIISTTPKNRLLIKELKRKAVEEVTDPDTGQREVVITSATTAENPHLDGSVKRALFEDYGNTRLGRQELYGEILEDVESALWKESIIDRNRLTVLQQPEHYDVKVVGVDPAAGGANEHGIVVCGRVNRYRAHLDHPYSNMPHAFVLDDMTCTGSPNQWAKAAIAAYRQHECNYIVAERNNGGEMVANTIHGIDPNVPVKLVWATRGKARRAEPISMLDEQGRTHHIGTFPDLEQQMCEFDPVDPDDAWSPDRMDAMVWAMTELMVGSGLITTREMVDTRLRGRR